MPTRMDRYREEQEESAQTLSRTERNEELYKNIYADREYSNIEGIASISKSNEIDIEKLKEMLKRKEEREERKYRTAEMEPVQNIEEEYEKQKEYDINEAIDRAKRENHEDNKHRSLKSVDLDFLKSLDRKDKKEEKEETKDDLEELLNTIASTKALNKLGDKELSLELLSELKSTGNTIVDKEENLKEVIKREMIEQELAKNEKKEEETAFFTTNNLFKKDDFENLEDLKNAVKDDTKKVKIIVIILGVIAVALAVYLIMKLWKG